MRAGGFSEESEAASLLLRGKASERREASVNWTAGGRLEGTETVSGLLRVYGRLYAVDELELLPHRNLMHLGQLHNYWGIILRIVELANDWRQRYTVTV